MSSDETMNTSIPVAKEDTNVKEVWVGTKFQTGREVSPEVIKGWHQAAGEGTGQSAGQAAGQAGDQAAGQGTGQAAGQAGGQAARDLQMDGDQDSYSHNPPQTAAVPYPGHGRGVFRPGGASLQIGQCNDLTMNQFHDGATVHQYHGNTPVHHYSGNAPVHHYHTGSTVHQHYDPSSSGTGRGAN